jgi:hypothetical protein
MFGAAGRAAGLPLVVLALADVNVAEGGGG